MSKIRDIIEEHLDLEYGIDERTLKGGDHLSNDLGLDSLDKVELEMECEKRFGVVIDGDTSEDITTLTELIKFVEDHIKDND